MEAFLSDLRHSLRMLRQNPSFTVAAVSALAVGIAANSAIFTVVNTVILRPLPFAASDRIVSIGRPHGGGTVAIPMFTFWERHNPGFEELAAYLPGTSMNLNNDDTPEVVSATRSSRNYFRLFGANPILGRTFTSQEDQPGGPRVLVMSSASGTVDSAAIHRFCTRPSASEVRPTQWSVSFRRVSSPTHRPTSGCPCKPIRRVPIKLMCLRWAPGFRAVSASRRPPLKWRWSENSTWKPRPIH